MEHTNDLSCCDTKSEVENKKEALDIVKSISENMGETVITNLSKTKDTTVTEEDDKMKTDAEIKELSSLFNKEPTTKSQSHRKQVLSKKINPKVNTLLAKKPKPVPQHKPLPIHRSNTDSSKNLPPPPPKGDAPKLEFDPNKKTSKPVLKKLPTTTIQKPQGKKELVFVLRGHIRDAFDDNSKIKDFVKLLSQKYNIVIYVHTWNKKECKKTWRHEASMYSWKKTPEELKVTKDTVMEYFSDFKHLIKKISLEDEELVKLNGRTEGQLTKICTMPTKSWKYFVHNLYTSLTEILPEDRHKTIFSLRLDMIQTRLFSTWHGFNHDNMLDSFFKICCSYIDRSNLKYKWCKMQSIGGSSSGYDNALLGEFDYLERIFHLLEMKLDDVLVKCAEQCDSRNQEIFVERLRDKLIHNINYFNFIFTGEQPPKLKS
ncbi:MAG: hypothetical protein CMF80_07190 [Candidatus Marinimicrobia bacterium]|nr:hypothetical protein [Candidatus Neomarinimicrobiota bacterium]|tara:strand:+ start:1060 stop:2349 length:1290 start_codon:yes stop_codon:yes gene_type:complete